ncbi:hypothetical protein JG688_00014288 [Phytophthora aleatoria]|uniref:ZSWIM1/3 RNaseH-like domain-containing protein n=1 Tax=Phytophthora aleatoria TaxID=2496075 RepID=A0A8J5J0P8_9STRA|nr:hypothetical protein JG688_00014288 [Phytophthora aleatoria]
MECIVEFFKRYNPLWKSIQTIVIDKDCVEWHVCEMPFLTPKYFCANVMLSRTGEKFAEDTS